MATDLLVPGTTDPTEVVAIQCVRDYLRIHTSLNYQGIQVEYDELPPNLSGNWHVVVIGTGFSVGNYSKANTLINDHSINFDIAIIRRVSETPKDRVRDKFVLNQSSLKNAAAQVNLLLDREYGLLQYCNATLASEYPWQAAYGFIEPAILRSPGQVRAAGSGLFGGANNEKVAAIVCRYQYTGLRRIWPKSLKTIPEVT